MTSFADFIAGYKSTNHNPVAEWVHNTHTANKPTVYRNKWLRDNYPSLRTDLKQIFLKEWMNAKRYLTPSDFRNNKIRCEWAARKMERRARFINHMETVK